MDKTRGGHFCEFVTFISQNGLIVIVWQVEDPHLDLDLSARIKPKLRMGCNVKAWGPQGQTMEFEPSCHVRLAHWRDLNHSLTELLGSSNSTSPAIALYSNRGGLWRWTALVRQRWQANNRYKGVCFQNRRWNWVPRNGTFYCSRNTSRTAHCRHK